MMEGLSKQESDIRAVISPRESYRRTVRSKSIAINLLEPSQFHDVKKVKFCIPQNKELLKSGHNYNRRMTLY